MRSLTPALVAAYMAVIVCANLSVAHFGIQALAFTAWVLIPFDMTLKDTLQMRWDATHGRSGVAVRMGALILAGAAVTVLSDASAARVAASSATAFVVAGTVDAIIFQVLTEFGVRRLVRVNASSLIAFVADSLIFPVLAFGDLDGRVFVSQALAKTVGGLIVSILLARTLWRTRWFDGVPK